MLTSLFALFSTLDVPGRRLAVYKLTCSTLNYLPKIKSFWLDNRHKTEKLSCDKNANELLSSL